MQGLINAWFSDSLAERTQDRMRAAVRAGRFPWPAPIGYVNLDKNLCIDPERGHFVRQAFEFMSSGRFPSGDAVLRLLTAMGFKTKKGRAVSKQTFARMLSNPIYMGLTHSRGEYFQGNHEPLVPEALFKAVQNQLNGKSRPHKKVNEDFPLRGVVRCAACGGFLTGSWPKGRRKRYPRYWCWNSKCKAVKLSREELENHFLNLLSQLQHTAQELAKLPEKVASQWQQRKAQIAADARSLSNRLADQKTLNQRAIFAKLESRLSSEEFDSVKAVISAEIASIEREIKSLDSERSTMEDLMLQAQAQAVDLVRTWQKGDVNQRHELANGLFPEGLSFSHKRLFFEPRNTLIVQMLGRFLEDLSNIGIPDGI